MTSRSAAGRSAGDTRLEADALYEIVSLVTGSLDLHGVLQNVVGLLTEATGCHACFLYLRQGSKLRLRAASSVYGHLVGRIELGLDEGLAGWAARTRTPAFVREDAMSDPRFKYVPEIDAERFQSLVAVPIPARSGEAIGVVLLHGEAPQDFDRGTVHLLEHTASLVAGAIENASLYEAANRRVGALTALTGLGERIASATTRDQLYRTVSEGVRTLLGCDLVALHVTDSLEGELELVATDPPGRTSAGVAGFELAATVHAGGEEVGRLIATGSREFSSEEDELLRAVASQVAVALKRMELIERLTSENVIRQVFDALKIADVQLARDRSRVARFDLERPYAIAAAAPLAGDERAWVDVCAELEKPLRRELPGTITDASPWGLALLVPLRGGADTSAEYEALRAVAQRAAVSLGISEPARHAASGPAAWRQATDAQSVATSLLPAGGALAYQELGVYKFLAHLAPAEETDDRLLRALTRLEEHDRRRRSSLVATLEAHLHHGRSPAATARALFLHPNTVRQRLARIDQISGIDVAVEDPLELELAIKIRKLKPR